jgi:hypothetical protein
MQRHFSRMNYEVNFWRMPMTLNHEELTERAAILADFIARDFMTVARNLRELHDEKPEVVMKVAELAGISRRRAYALIRISRQFDQYKIPEDRLKRIGWTRLQLIGRYLEKGNVHELLAIAEANTVHNLELILRGDPPMPDARVVVGYFSPSDHQRLTKALISLGAAPSGIGLIGVEQALMKLVDLYLDS